MVDENKTPESTLKHLRQSRLDELLRLLAYLDKHAASKQFFD